MVISKALSRATTSNAATSGPCRSCPVASRVDRLCTGRPSDRPARGAPARGSVTDCLPSRRPRRDFHEATRSRVRRPRPGRERLPTRPSNPSATRCRAMRIPRRLLSGWKRPHRQASSRCREGALSAEWLGSPKRGYAAGVTTHYAEYRRKSRYGDPMFHFWRAHLVGATGVCWRDDALFRSAAPSPSSVDGSVGDTLSDRRHRPIRSLL